MRQCIFYTNAPLCTSAGLHLSLPWGYTHRWTGTIGLAEAKKLNMRITQQLRLYHLASNPLYCIVLGCLRGNTENQYDLGC